MNTLKRAMTYIKRQLGKNIVLFVLIFVLACVMSAAISVRNAIIAMEESVMLRIPTISSIHLDIDEIVEEFGTFQNWSNHYADTVATMRPTIEEITAIGELEYVRTYDYILYGDLRLPSSDLFWYIPPIDRDRIIPDLSQWGLFDQITQGVRDQFNLNFETFPKRGIHNHQMTDIESGIISLAQGRTFTTTEISNGAMVAVVSSGFAMNNNLTIGSTFELYSAVSRNPENMDILSEESVVSYDVIELEIIGIFDVEKEFDYEAYTTLDIMTPLEQYVWLHNRIYVPFALADYYHRAREQVRLDNDLRALDDYVFIEAVFLLNNPRYFDNFTETARNILPPYWTVFNLSGTFSSIITSMNTMLEIADVILLITIGATIATLVLAINIFLQDRKKEIGIYMALGEKKGRIILQFVSEIFIVATTSIVLALFVGNFISNNISRNLFEQSLIDNALLQVPTQAGELPWELILHQTTSMSTEEVMNLYNTSLNANTIILFVTICVGLILIATILPIINILKFNPKKVLLEK